MAAPINIQASLFLADVKNADIISNQISKTLENALGSVSKTVFGNLNKEFASAGQALRLGLRDASADLANMLQDLRRVGGGESGVFKGLFSALPKVGQNLNEELNKLDRATARITKQLTSADSNLRSLGEKNAGRLARLADNTTSPELQSAIYQRLTGLVKDYTTTYKSTAKDREASNLAVQNKIAANEAESQARIRSESEKTVSQFNKEYESREKLRQDTLGKQNAQGFQSNLNDKSKTFSDLRSDIERRNAVQYAKEELAVNLEQSIAKAKAKEQALEELAISKELVIQTKERALELKKLEAIESQIASEASRTVSIQDKLRDIVNRASKAGISNSGISTLRSVTQLDPKKIATAKVGGTPLIDERQIGLLAKAELATIQLAEAQKRASISAQDFGEKTALAFKRFAAFLVGSAPLFFLIQSFRTASAEAIKFEHQVTKIEQVLEITADQANAIGREIAKVAAQTGTAIDDIAEGVQQLAQAGFKDPAGLTSFAKEIAKVPLAATFDGIGKTTEGLIAIFGQFHKTLGDTAEILDLVNQFAADFAVESKDIFEAVARGGAAFSTAGGDLKEFIGLFSLLRSATRESAETLGNFFKTSVADLLAKKSKTKLTLLGIDTDKSITDQLEQLSGKLVGPNSKLGKQEVIKIAVDLVGTRQFNRFLTLLQELQDPAKRKQIDESLSSASGSLNRAAGKRLDDIGVSFDRIKQSFTEFIVTITQSDGLKKFVKDLADITHSLLEVAKALSPVLPLFASFATLLVLPKIGSFLSGLTGLSIAGKKGAGFGGTLAGIGSAIGQTPIAIGLSSLLTNPFGRGLDSNLGPLSQSANAQIAARRQLGNFAVNGAFIGAGLIGSSLSTSENRTTRNAGSILEGVATGGVIGAGLGSAIPVVGTAVGAVVGGLIGGFVSLTKTIKENNKAELEKRIAEAGDDPNARLRILFSNGDAASGSNSNTKKLLGEINSGGPIGTEINKLFGKISSKLLESLTDDKKAQELFSKNSSDVNFKDIFTKYFDDFVKQLVQDGLSADQATIIAEKLGAGLSQLFDKIDLQRALAQVIKDLEEQFDRVFGSVSRSFQVILRNISGGFEKLDEFSKDFSDKLNSIITNPNELVKAQPSSSNKTLFSQNGFGSINGLKDLINLFGKEISAAFNDPTISKNIHKFAKDLGTKSTEELEGINANELLKNALGDEGLAKQLAPIFDALSAFSKKSVADIIKEFEANSGAINDVIKGLIGGEDAFNKIAEAIRQRYELINKEAELNKSLTDSLRTLAGQLYEAQNKIKDLGDALQDRITDQSNFTNRTDGLTSQLNRANVLGGRAGQTSFGSSKAFITDILAAAQDRNNKVNAAGNLNRTGFAFNDPKALQTLKDSQDSQARLADLQQELGQRISELDKRIGNAAAATDLLRSAFNELDGQIKTSGQAVLQFGKIDLARSLSAFDRFLSNGGATNPGGALEKLTAKDFSRVQSLLGAAGNFNLGKGINGSQLLGDISKSLGIPFLAAIRSRVTGESQDQAESSITKELQDIKDQQAAAAKVEEQLRNEQISLLQAQSNLIPIEQQFYKDQISILQQIVQLSGSQLDPLNSIKNDVSKILDTISTVIGAINPDFVGPIPIPNPNFSLPKLPNTPSVFNGYPGIPLNQEPVKLIGTSPEYQNQFNTKNKQYPPIAPDFGKPFGSNPDSIISSDSILGNNLRVPDEFTHMDTNISAIRDTLDRLYDYATTNSNPASNGPQTTFNLNIAPMQVNVALSAPDILALAGPQLQVNIEKAIGLKLSEIFKGDPETAGKIDSKFQTR